MKSFTDIEQSQELAKFLPEETADCHYVRKTCDFMGNPVDGKWSTPKYGNPQSSLANYIVQNFTCFEKIPCWSLAALLDYLSANFRVDIKYLENHWEFDCRARVAYNKELVDACAEMIIKLNEQKIL